MTVPPPNPDSCLNIGDVVQYEGQDVLCTIEGTLYGYYPSLVANTFFAGAFGVWIIWNLYFGIRYKTWTFMIALCLGCIAEVLGYVGRIMMYNDPFDHDAFIIQICCLIIAPAFLAAGIYLTLKRIVITFGEEWSRLKPAWYTRIFIAGDLLSLVLQGAGGGIASTADSGSDMQDIGTDLMIAGVIFQVVILMAFGYLLSEYIVRTYRRRDQLSMDAVTLLHKKRFYCFMGGILTAYITILVRCVYRIPELTGGWRSELMRDEPEFIALEGAMIIVAASVLSIFHPGYCFLALTKNTEPQGKSFSENNTFEMIDTV